MSLNINRILLAGHLTRDPEVRIFAQENTVANFGLAINRRFKGSDGQMKEEVTFVDCEAWGRTAELAGQYLTKGRAVFVEGRLKLDTWQDKEGKNRSRLKVVIDSLQFVGGNPNAGGADKPADGQPAGDAPAKPARPATPADDEPPF